jgi:putative phosphoribosyl transferase
MRFSDRSAAGRALAGRLQHYAGRDDVLVLALPRGGVPVALEVARDLQAPLDVLVVRKLAAPGREELVLGAVAEGGETVLSQDLMLELGIPQRRMNEAIARERQELERHERQYRGERPPAAASGRIAIVVDDGVATGATMRAAALALRRRAARRIVAAVPVAAVASCEQFRGEVDELVCVRAVESLHLVGDWYEHFPRLAGQDVCEILSLARSPA